jgi:hypothetical protein
MVGVAPTQNAPSRPSRHSGAGTSPESEPPTSLIAPGAIIQFGVPPNRIDLISEIDGIDFDAAWEARVEAIFVGVAGETPIHYLSLNDLIKNKQVTGRPKDMDDLAYLKEARDRR